MKRLFIYFMAALLSAGLSLRVQAKPKKKAANKTSQSVAKPTKQNGAYAKLFKDKSKHTVCKGMLSIHKYEDKVYLEVPLKLMGKDILVSSAIINSSDISLSGTNAARNRCITMDKTDSLVLFRIPRYNVRLNENDSIQKEAFAISGRDAIYKSFPIAGYNADSTAVLFNATSYFSCSNKDILDLTGKSYEGMTAIASVTPDAKTSFIGDISAHENSVSVIQNGTVKLGVSVMGFLSTEQPEVSMAIRCTLTLLSDWLMNTREANPKVGSGYIEYTDYRNEKRVRQGYHATRRNLIHKFTLYVDTLIQDSWVQAVRKSVDGWNDAFSELDLGRPIEMKPYPANPAFKADDPMLNTVSFLNNNKSNVTVYNVTDPRTGEIICTKIGLPRNIAYSLRRNAVYQMAEVDERFRTYYIPDDVICEYITARMLKAIGYGLGLASNLAGSGAFSPEQLRSAEFTKKYGITASVMDNVIYNYLARPGDKEKGVKLIVDKPGICDKFTLKYLYDRTGSDEAATLKKWVDDRDGNPCYFYGKQPPAYAADPRCQSYDLGNDPIAALDAKVARVKYVVENSATWFHDDNISEEYRSLFPDFFVIELINKTLSPMSAYIGGVYIDETGREDGRASFKPVPADMQRKVTKKILDTFYDLKWADSNPAFLRLGGANANMTTWIYNNGFPMRTLMFRLTRMGLSVDKSDNPYTQEEYLTDIEHRLFKETLDGKPLSAEMIPQIETYISALKQASPALKAIESAKAPKQTAAALQNTESTIALEQPAETFGDENAAEDNGMKPLTEISYYQGTDIDTVCYDKLKSALRCLKKARSLARNDIERGKCDYLIMKINRVM